MRRKWNAWLVGALPCAFAVAAMLAMKTRHAPLPGATLASLAAPARDAIRAEPLASENESEIDSGVVAPPRRIAIEAEPRPVGSISGTVVQAGVPVPGVIVFAFLDDEESRHWVQPSWDDEGTEQLAPHTTTDGAGRFTFAGVRPGGWDLRALAPKSPLPTLPARVVVTDHAPGVTQDLELGSARVIGQLDLAATKGASKTAMSAWLFPLERASDDPYFQHCDGSVIESMRAAAIDGDGRFEIAALRAGSYVVRIGMRSAGAGIQRVVRLASQTVDLGVLRPTQGPRATLRCADERVEGAWLRQPVHGSERGVFVATVSCGKGGFVLPRLEPGEYMVEPFEEIHDRRPSWLHSFGVVVSVRIDADGIAEPQEIVLPQGASPQLRTR